MDVSFDSVDSVYEPFDWTYDLTDLQYETTNRECDLTDYDPYVSTASVCAQTEAFDSVHSVYEPMEPTYGITGLQCKPTCFSYAPTDLEHELKDIDPYAPTEEPFEQTEGKAWRLLAACIPPELFDNILFYVNADRVSQRKYNGGNGLTRNRGQSSTKDILTDLKQCSLVCLFWANRCREHMFSDNALFIKSYEEAAIFRRYIVGGCPRLTPVHRLITDIYVTQNYSGESAPQPHERQMSFLHLLYLPAIQDKLGLLFINGPVPDGFNHAKLDTPHWSIPPSVVVPGSFLRSEISLTDVHFPSFYHVIKYISHFNNAPLIRFQNITWDGQMALSLPHASSTVARQRRPPSLRISAMRDCTDSVHLALTALMANPNCPLHRLSDEERVWMIKFMTLLWGDKKDHSGTIEFDISEQTTTMRMGPFRFVFEEAPATDRSASALSVVGMHAYISSLPFNFDALVNHARTQRTIRALVLLFDSFALLQESTKPFVEVLTLAAETIDLVLAYEKEEEHKAVGVDLATLELNGRVDIWTDERSKRYWGGRLSSQMLQQQLKKKRWMSVH